LHRGAEAVITYRGAANLNYGSDSNSSSGIPFYLQRIKKKLFEKSWLLKKFYKLLQSYLDREPKPVLEPEP
jgi:hypothetical protein